MTSDPCYAVLTNRNASNWLSGWFSGWLSGWMGLALFIVPCRDIDAEDFVLDPGLRGGPALRIAREHAELARACDLSTGSARAPSAGQSVRRARAVLFAADGLLEDSRDPAATLSALKRRLHTGLTWPGSARDAERHHLVAMLAFRLGDPSESLRHAARAVLSAPSSSRYHSNLAFFLHVARRPREARLLYERARRMDPDNTAAHLGLLSVAADSAHPDLHEMESLARDWRQRERVPELARMADTLAQVLSRLTSLELPVESKEHESTAEEVRLVKAMLQELMGSPERTASHGKRPVAPESAPGTRDGSRDGSRRGSRRVTDGLSYRVGGTRP